MKNQLRLILILTGIFTICSCSFNLADESLVERATDTVPPMITITKPSGGEPCANLIEVSGTVTDTTNKKGKGKIENLSWEVPNTALGESSILIAENGSFSFVLDAGDLFGNFTLSFSATDWNGNKTIKSISLLRETGNTLPSFKVTAGNKALNLEWDAVPETAYYLVYYNADGSIPDLTADQGIQIAPSENSYQIDGCVNGNVYYVALKAVAESGSSSVSNFKKGLPLSPRTLCPNIVSANDSLTITWSQISATNRFEIWRRTGMTGDFGLYAETSGYEYIDKNVEKNTWYSYKIRPALEGSILSESERGIPQWFESRPRNVREISTNRMNSYGKMQREGDYLYACGVLTNYTSTGFSIFDISDASNPAFCSYIEVPAIDVSVQGTIVYILTEGFSHMFAPLATADLIILDVEDPYRPTILSITEIRDLDSDDGNYSQSTCGWGLTTTENRAYIAAGLDGIQEYDISNPENPLFLRATEVDNAVFTGLTICEDYLYATCINYTDLYYGLVAFDLDTLAFSSGIVSNDLGTNKHFLYPKGVRVINHTFTLFGTEYSQNRLYVMDNTNGVHVFNLYNPATPEYEYSIDTPGIPQDVHLDEGFLYIADGTGSLQICKQSPESILRYELDRSLLVAMPRETVGIATKDGYAFVGASYGGFQLVDIGMPSVRSTPTLVSRDDNNLGGNYNGFNSLAACGPIAYVANYTGLTVIDTSDTTNVTWETLTPTGSTRFDIISVSGDLLLTKDNNYIAALDLSDPLHPVFLGKTIVDYQVFTIAARGDYAYVGGTNGLNIYDISNPAHMEKVSVLKTTNVKSIAFKGNIAYLYGSAGMTVVDISKPKNATILSMHMYRNRDDSATSIRISGNYAFASDNYSGLYIFNITNPNNIPAPNEPTSNDSLNACNFTDALSAGGWTIVLTSYGLKLLYNTSNPETPIFVKTLEKAIEAPSYIIPSSGVINGSTMITLDAEGVKIFELDE